jgi:WD40 repeat protein/tRNA A-37 threonylcarbamoyl transferase component Bud32
MSPRPPGRDREQSLNEQIAAYLEAEQAGQTPDAEAWVARCPELADELRRFLANHAYLARLGAPLRAIAAPGPFDTVDDVTPGQGGSPPYRSPPACAGPFGDYELLEEIARGGMGVVYKARQKSLNRVVALKMILSGRLASEADVLRFRQEAEAAASLDHPHIVPVYEVGEHEGQHYFSMKLIEGGNLGRHAGRFRRDQRAAARLLAVVARAVHYAHQRGILHRDLKPANILLDDRGQPHVTDFGLARRLGEGQGQTPSGGIIGTAGYMAPEQARGERDVTTAADVHGLGAILYELLTERPPYWAATRLDTILRVLDGEPVKPRSLRPRLDRDLETVCLKCLHKEPAKRYPSALALAEDLERWLRGEPISARPSTGWERARRWARRRPAAAAVYGLAVLVAVLGGLGGGATWLWQRSEEDREQLAQEKRQTEAALLREQEATEAAQQARRSEERLKDELDQVLYLHRVSLAYAEWRNNEVARARQLLEECPAGRRHWEWGYVHRLCHPELRTLRGHTGVVFGVAFSPDGKTLASGSGGREGGKWCGEVKLWDVATGRLLLAWTGHTGYVAGVAFSPDGRRLASASADQTVKVWDARTGREALTLTGHIDKVHGVAFSPDGRRLASASDRTVRVWDAQTGEQTLTLRGHTGVVFSVAFSPDGKRLASASGDRTVRVWDAQTGREALTLTGHTDMVFRVAFSPDGRRLASASPRDRTVRVWDAQTGREALALTGLPNGARCVAFSPDSRLLACPWDSRTVKLWDARTGREALTLTGHGGGVFNVAFSPNGRLLASTAGDRTVKVWEAQTGQGTLTLECTGWRTAFSPDGRLLAGGWDGNTARVWDAQTGRQTLTLRGHTGAVWGVAFSPDGQRLASASWDKAVKVWDARTGREALTLTGHTGQVGCVAFSPDGRRLASASGDGTVKVWDAQTGREALTLTGHTRGVASVAFSPDGRRLASAGYKGVKVWDVRTGREALTLQGHTGWVQSVAFSPDGRRLASAGDETVRVWDARTGREALTLRGQTQGVFSVAFSPDGRRLATASADRTVRVWDAQTGREALTLTGHTGWVQSVAFSPDGRRLTSTSQDKTMKVWDAPAGP